MGAGGGHGGGRGGNAVQPACSPLPRAPSLLTGSLQGSSQGGRPHHWGCCGAAAGVAAEQCCLGSLQVWAYTAHLLLTNSQQW